MLEKMENLNSLGLANNQIEVLNADTFEGNQKLSDIFLQNNQLKAIADGSFRDSRINLSGNPCARYKSPMWIYEDCVEEYDRRKSSTTLSQSKYFNPAIVVIAILILFILIMILLILIKRLSKTGATHYPLVSSTSAQRHGQDSNKPSELIYADLDMARGQAPATNLVSTRGHSNMEETQYATIQDVSQQSVTYASIGDFAPVVPRHLKK
jgi:hypothetical protein